MSLSGLAFAAPPTVVQTQLAIAPQITAGSTITYDGSRCVFSFPSHAIRSGDTVVGYIHSADSVDANPMTPDGVYDSTGAVYNLTPALQWLPWPEDVKIFYLESVLGGPTSLTFDFSSQSAYLTGDAHSTCDIGFAEYTPGKVVVTGPTLVSGTSPSISTTVPTDAAVWLYAADFRTNGFAALHNSGFVGIIDNWAQDDMGVWSGVPDAGPLTLTLNAPQGSSCAYSISGCPTALAVVTLQGTGSSPPPPGQCLSFSLPSTVMDSAGNIWNFTATLTPTICQ